jgi:catabolite regulation protein CreA
MRIAKYGTAILELGDIVPYRSQGSQQILIHLDYSKKVYPGREKSSTLTIPMKSQVDN